MKKPAKFPCPACGGGIEIEPNDYLADQFPCPNCNKSLKIDDYFDYMYEKETDVSLWSRLFDVGFAILLMVFAGIYLIIGFIFSLLSPSLGWIQMTLMMILLILTMQSFHRQFDTKREWTWADTKRKFARLREIKNQDNRIVR